MQIVDTIVTPGTTGGYALIEFVGAGGESVSVTLNSPESDDSDMLIAPRKSPATLQKGKYLKMRSGVARSSFASLSKASRTMRFTCSTRKAMLSAGTPVPSE